MTITGITSILETRKARQITVIIITKPLTIHQKMTASASRAWYVPAKNTTTNKCIVFVHGHFSNRLRTMKYLDLSRVTGLDREHALFFPDLRNSGMAEPAKTAMGFEFAEDLFYSLLMLNIKYDITNVTLYGFSMGAIIYLLTHPTIWIFYLGNQCYLPKMRLSVLYRDIYIPLLILQAEDDPLCYADILHVELSHLDNEAATVRYFKTGTHVKAFQMPENRETYIRFVDDLMNK